MKKTKEEEVRSEIKSAIEEWKKAKEELSAATVFHPQRRFFPRISIRQSLILSFIGLMILFSIVLYFSIKSLFFKEGTVEITTTSFIERIEDLSQLATSKAYMKAVIEQEDNELFGKKIDVNLPGTKRKLLVIIPGEVTAGVDLAKINEEHIKINEVKKEVRITLPKGEILQEPTLFFDQIRIFSSEGLFRGEATISEGYEIANLAKEQIKTEAIEHGLLNNAENQAKEVVEQFFKTIGYKAIVEFEK